MGFLKTYFDKNITIYVLTFSKSSSKLFNPNILFKLTILFIPAKSFSSI